jgi:hypothetical protein
MGTVKGGWVRNRFGEFAVQAGNRSLTVAARLRLLLIQRELPSRDREEAVLTSEEFSKMVTQGGSRRQPAQLTASVTGTNCQDRTPWDRLDGN